MRLFFISFLLLICSVTGLSQKVLTLNEAINIALQRNADLQKSVNNIESYKSNVKASYGNLLPTVGASGSWNWSKTQYENAPTIDASRYSVGIGTDWTIFDGLSNYASLSQSQNSLESAQFNLERLKQSIVFQTITYYYDVINNRQLLLVQEENVKWNEKNLETITERNKLGAVTLADVYAQQVKSGNAELELIRAKNNLETSKSDLLYYLGLDVLSEYSYADSLNVSETRVINEHSTAGFEDIRSMVNQALESRSDYKSAKLEFENSLLGITIAKGGHYPRLSNSNNFSTSAGSMNDLFKTKTYSVGLSLNIPIFSGFSVENRVELAEVNSMNSKVDLNNIERDIKRGIQKSWLDLQAAEKALEVSRSNIKAAEENRRIEQEKYNLGSGTLLNVLIASSEYTNAKTNFINAQFAFITLSEQLKYQIGLLDYKKYQ